MSAKIMWTAAIFFGGWLWSYVFIRQIMFNFLVATPLIKKLRAMQQDLIAVGADRYTAVSTATCAVIALLVLVLVIRFCPLYLSIAFGVGALTAFVMLFYLVTPRERSMFDAFCNAYYRFIPDDELRTALFNKKTGPIRARLKAMGLTGEFIPEFKKK